MEVHEFLGENTTKKRPRRIHVGTPGAFITPTLSARKASPRSIEAVTVAMSKSHGRPTNRLATGAGLLGRCTTFGATWVATRATSAARVDVWGSAAGLRLSRGTSSTLTSTPSSMLPTALYRGVVEWT